MIAIQDRDNPEFPFRNGIGDAVRGKLLLNFGIKAEPINMAKPTGIE